MPIKHKTPRDSPKYVGGQICIWRRPGDTRIIKLGAPRPFIGSWMYKVSNVELIIQDNYNYKNLSNEYAAESELEHIDLIELGLFRQKLDQILVEEAKRLSDK